MNTFFRIYIEGILVLIAAIIINGVAKYFEVSTWYDFLGKISELGFTKAISQTSSVSIIFMFIIYPFFLGMSFFLLKKILG